MSLDLTLLSVTSSRRHTKWMFKAAPHSATNYTAGGDTIDLTGATVSGKFLTLPYTVPTSDEVIIETVKGGHSVDFVPDGTTPTFKNAKLKIYTAAATELSAGAYPATLTSIVFSIEQKRR